MEFKARSRPCCRLPWPARRVQRQQQLGVDASFGALQRPIGLAECTGDCMVHAIACLHFFSLLSALKWAVRAGLGECVYMQLSCR